MKLLSVLLLSLCIVGCGKKTETKTQFVTQYVHDNTPIDNVQRLIDDENEYRLGLGQSALTQGLSCNVQAVSSGQWLSNSSPGYNAGQGVVTVTGTNYTFLLTHEVNQPDALSGSTNMVLPSAIANLFASINYRIGCAGHIVVTETGYYLFDLSSDDGSILTIDNVQVVNNDGSHGITSKQGTRFLREGVHTMNLLYAQTGSGNFALILKANNQVIPGSVFYH